MSDVAAAAPQMVKEAVQVMKVTHRRTLGSSPSIHTDVNRCCFTVHPKCAETG